MRQHHPTTVFGLAALRLTVMLITASMSPPSERPIKLQDVRVLAMP